ncbi:hypothetical protein L9F63_009684, partial [Diploptera punctata]
VRDNYLDVMSVNFTDHSLRIEYCRQHGDHYDFIVVGAGSAGCVVANRLSEIDDWKVLLIEAGGEEPLEMSVPVFKDYAVDTKIDWQYKTQPTPGVCAGKPCSWPRGKTLGGTSVLNWMVYFRGNKRDYENWESLGNADWGYEDVLPFFKKSENNMDPEIARNEKYHSVGGYLSVQKFLYADENTKLILQAYEDMGYGVEDSNAETMSGFAISQATYHNGERRSTNRAFIEPIRDVRKNLKVVTNVRVTKVLINPKTKQAYGVEVAHEDSRSIFGKVYADKEVIVSGGSVNSPQLLMLSGIGPKDTLNKVGIKVIKDLDVGKNLQEHSTAYGFNLTREDYGSKLSPEEELKRDMRDYLNRTGPFATIGTTSVIGFISSRHAPKDEDYPDLEIGYYATINPTEKQKCGSVYLTPSDYYNSMTYFPFLFRPQSRGYITINSSDPFDHPLIYPNYFTDVRDLEAIIDGYNFGMKVLDNPIFKRTGFKLNRQKREMCVDYKFGSDDYWICIAKNYTRPDHHPAGTCRMGPKHDRTAVVDPKLRVYGIKGLRVADCSIMPNITSSNLNAVAIMIGRTMRRFY